MASGLSPLRTPLHEIRRLDSRVALTTEALHGALIELLGDGEEALLMSPCVLTLISGTSDDGAAVRCIAIAAPEIV
jgi:hypothetical protein